MSATVSITRGTLLTGGAPDPAEERCVTSPPMDFAEVSFAPWGLAGWRQRDRNYSGFEAGALGENHLKTALYCPVRPPPRRPPLRPMQACANLLEDGTRH